MYVLTTYLLGIFYIHAFWLYFYLIGSLVWTADEPQLSHHVTRNNHPRALADLVITTTTGISITGFILFFLGIVGLLNIYTVVLSCLILPCLVFWYGRRESVLRFSFWRRRYIRLSEAKTITALIIYVIFLILAVPAVIPPMLWDSISYHLAYAVDFANAGKIYVDVFLRFPYYTNNFLLIHSLMFILKLGNFCHFMSWLCGLLTCLGVYAFLDENSPTRSEATPTYRLISSAKKIIIVLTLALSPVFLRYLNVAYIDVPIGLFILVPVLCAYFSIRYKEGHYEIHLILTAAFCVGMKISHFLMLPLFLGSLLICLRHYSKNSLKLAMCLALLVLSSPWYVRNMIRAGDPISPTLNLLLTGNDPIYSLEDYRGLTADFITPKSLRLITTLPIDFFSNPLSPVFREYGISLVVIFLYLPVIMILLLLIAKFRKIVGYEFIYLNFALIYLVLIWVGISPLGRYFLPVFPVYTCYIGACVSGITSRLRAKLGSTGPRRIVLEAVTTVLLLSMLIQSPNSGVYFDSVVQENYLHLPERMPSRQEFLRRNLPGYASTQIILTGLKSNRMENYRVLTVGFENLAFYFRRNKIVSMGDWFGPGRYADLVANINNGDLASYLERFRIGAVLVNLADRRISGADNQIFMKQLEDNNFIRLQSPEATAIFVKASPEHQQ